MRTSLVSIPTDTIPLDGAYYEPEGAAKGAVLLFHGNTMNFYVGAPRFLPPVLTRLGLACLAFNRRGHDIMSTFNSRDAVGGAYQSTAEAIADNRTAAQWLAARGIRRSGRDRPQQRRHARRTARRGSPADAGAGPAVRGQGRHAARIGRPGEPLRRRPAGEFTAQAREMVNAGRGRDLMLIPGWWYVITAESFLDRIVSVPDTLALAPQVKCPVLTLRGDKEDGRPLSGGRIPEACRRAVQGRDRAGLRSLLQRQGRAGRGDRQRLAGKDACACRARHSVQKAATRRLRKTRREIQKRDSFVPSCLRVEAVG